MSLSSLSLPHRILVSLVLCTVIASPARAAQRTVCHVVLENCLDTYAGKSILVPTEAVAVHTEVPNCPPSMELTTNVPASIMLLIDDSNSTLFSDSGGVRFEVIDSLIEIISRTQPEARLGAAAFTGKLAWNVEGANDNGILEPLGQDRSNAYLPIKPLTEQVNGRSYKDILKEYLRKDPQANRFGSWTNTRSSGTDITLAFEAARDAFDKNAYSKGTRFEFIIFISDGKAAVTDPARAGTENDYRTCSEMTDIPATFTVFLSRNSGSEPPELTEMNDCIRTNGYSTSNHMSEIWFVVSNQKDRFLSVMRDEILYDISSVQVDAGVTFKSASLGGVALTARDANTLVAQKPIALQPGVTSMNYSLTYGYQSSSGPRDTVIRGSFTLSRDDAAAWSSLVTHGISRRCYERSLSMSANGFPVAAGQVIVKEDTPMIIDATLEGVEGRPSIAVSSAGGRDALQIAANEVVGTADRFQASFEHVVNPENPVIAGKLEMTFDDRIAVVWRNPDIPLDTIGLINAFSSTPIPPFEYTVGMLPNPTNFTETIEITKGVSKTYTGAVIAVGTSLPADSVVNEVVAASAIVYDAVGNVITSLIADTDDMGGAYAYLEWDGTNTKDRRVGTGTYLAIVSVTFLNTDTDLRSEHHHRVMLGVKR